MLLVCRIYIIATVLQTVYSITATSPCDPIQTGKTIADIYKRNEFEIALHHLHLEWMTTPMAFINCSKRGLTRIPNTINNNVEIMDLSYNAITLFEKSKFEQLTNLVALFISNNCPISLKSERSFCGQTITLQENVFQNLTHLKMLGLANNNLKQFPKTLPQTLQYIDISQTAIERIRKIDVAHMVNLAAFIANDVCLEHITGISSLCSSAFEIEPHAFESSNSSLKMLSVAKNNFNRTKLITLTYPNLFALILDRTRIKTDGELEFQYSPNLRYLSLQQLYPDQEQLVTITNRTFSSLRKLEYLDVSFNFLPPLPNDTFQFNQNLMFLDVSANCFTSTVENPGFLNINSLKHLYIGFNNYCLQSSKQIGRYHNRSTLKLGPAYSKLENLELLSFGLPSSGYGLVTSDARGSNFNTITNQSLVVLNELKYLTALVLAYCQIGQFDIMALAGLKNLTYFDISKNYNEDTYLFQCNCTSYNESVNIREWHGKLSQSSMTSAVTQHKQRLDSNQNLSSCEHITFDFASNRLTKVHYEMFPFALSNHSFARSLDLSSNHIVTLRENAFLAWPSLCFIDLTNNPIVYIHYTAFAKIPSLEYLSFDSAELIRAYTDLSFLSNISNSLNFKWIYGDFFTTFFPTGYDKRKFPLVTSIDFSHNNLPSEAILQNVFDSFPSVTSITLCYCNIYSSYFSLTNSNVTYLNMGHNALPSLPTNALMNMRGLKYLFLPKNKISFVPDNLFNMTPFLEELDLSYNRITHINQSVFIPFPSNLKKLDVKYNYLVEMPLTVMPSGDLILDLRWNYFACSCELTNSFGQWLTNQSYYLENRLGLLPFCSSLLIEYYDGCVSCFNDDDSEVALLSFCANKSCEESIFLYLCLGFTSFILIFIILVDLFTSKQWQKWCANQLLKDIISFRNGSINKTPTHSRLYSYHACICFDLYDNKSCDWVDYHLVPNLEPHCRLTVTGRDDHCGISPVQQLLQKIEASRIVLFLMTTNFVNSNEGKYILSALEYLEYRYGIDRMMILKFEDDKQTGGLLQKRIKCKPWSVLNVPDDEECWPLLWTTLKTLLKRL